MLVISAGIEPLIRYMMKWQSVELTLMKGTSCALLDGAIENSPFCSRSTTTMFRESPSEDIVRERANHDGAGYSRSEEGFMGRFLATDFP